MARPSPHDHDAALERELAALKAQYETLRDEKVRSEQTLSHLEGQLRDLEEKAREQYGTADPEELGRMLEAMRAENGRLVAEYREHLRQVQDGLAQLEAAGREGA